MKNSIFAFIICIFFGNAVILKAGDFEDYSWWNKTQNWDGFSSWTSYLKTSAAFFGPNALPIPTLNQAIINQKIIFEFRPEYHWSKGDKTSDVFTSLKLPLASRVDFEIFIVPIEYFTLDSVARFERAVRHLNAKGIAGGDFWFGTNFQILRQKNRIPDLIASFYFKTASGTNLDYARFTDAPGYYIMISSGKDLIQNKDKNRNLRLYGQAGFYAYQTWDDLHSQNDCIIFGAGIKYTNMIFIANFEIAGYLGYFEKGDSPVVLKAKIITKKEKLNLALNLQSGIHDFDYQSIGLSLVYSFGKTFNQ